MCGIAELNAAALQDWHSVDLRLELVYAPEAEEQVREMVRYERECCAFLSFEVQEDQNCLRVIVQAPDAARDAAEFIFECLRSKAQTAAGLQSPPDFSK
ncbi:MAG TPA: hypothetical protein VGI45_32145 [Terracidiphilus sp.]